MTKKSGFLPIPTVSFGEDLIGEPRVRGEASFRTEELVLEILGPGLPRRGDAPRLLLNPILAVFAGFLYER